MKSIILTFLAVLCSTASWASVTIISPTGSSSTNYINEPATFTIDATSNDSGVANMQVWDNTLGVKLGVETGSTFNKSVTLSSGSTTKRTIVVESVNSSSVTINKAYIYVNISSSSSLIPTPPSTATYLTQLDDLKPTYGSQYYSSGTTSPYFQSQNPAYTWSKICTGACSGCPTGSYTTTCTPTTAPAAKWFWEPQTSGTLDGLSALFGVESTSSSGYPSALWAVHLGNHESLSHFIYDFKFNINTSTSNIQALEWDLIQGDSAGDKFLWGTQCNFAHSSTFDIWSWSSTWVHTSTYCPNFSSNAWHHVRLYGTKTSSSLTYVAVEFDGTQHSINTTVSPKYSDGTYAVTMQFQLDQKTGSAPGYTMKVDEAQVIGW